MVKQFTIGIAYDGKEGESIREVVCPVQSAANDDGSHNETACIIDSKLRLSGDIMRREILLLPLQILCIVHLSSSMTRTTNVPEVTSEEDQEDIRTNFVSNGVLLRTWSDNLTEFTEDIDLSNLEIEVIQEGAFGKFVALNELNLSSNKLTSTKNVVAAIQSARPLILNLSNNNLGSSDHDRPTLYDDRSYKQWKTFLFDSKYFWSVDISRNSLKGIGVDFEAVHLNLSNNLMRCHSAIESRRFYGKPIYVGNLDLSHNLIDCQDLFFTSNIDTLDMSYNKLKGLDADGLLRRLPILTVLNLANNNIRYIHPRAFEETVRLQVLYLQFNQIRTIYKQVWAPLRAMRYIDLSSNRLENLDWNDVTFFGKREFDIVVDLRNNSNVKYLSNSDYFKLCTKFYPPSVGINNDCVLKDTNQ